MQAIYFEYDQTFRSTKPKHIESTSPRMEWAGIEMLTSGLRSEPVNRVIALTLRAYLATKREGGRSGERTTVLVDISDADLDRSVVLGSDEPA
jgi:hypothetical protein